MRRVAASRVYLNSKDYHTNHIVEIVDSFVVNHYSLSSELPMTEWLGGAILLTTAQLTVEDIRNIKTITDFYNLADKKSKHSFRTQAFHFSNIYLASESLTEQSLATQLAETEEIS